MGIGQITGCRTARTLQGNDCDASFAIDHGGQVRVIDAIVLDRTINCCELHAFGGLGPVGGCGKGSGAFGYCFGKSGGWGDLIDEAPINCPLATYAFHGCAEEVCKIAAHAALVDQPGQPTGAR